MTSTTSDHRVVPAGEPKPVIAPLASFYLHARELGWLIVRLTAGGMLLVHGVFKLMPAMKTGLAATVQAFAAGSMARRGIEPSLPFAWAVFLIETVGALLIVLGILSLGDRFSGPGPGAVARRDPNFGGDQ